MPKKCNIPKKMSCCFHQRLGRFSADDWRKRVKKYAKTHQYGQVKTNRKRLCVVETILLRFLWNENGNFSHKINENGCEVNTLFNRPRSIYQYSSMAPRLSGQNCKFFKFLCPSIPKRDLDTKKTTSNINV